MNLLDLPDEILLLILKKLNVVDTLFRQSGLHSRLDQLLFDHAYVRELDFTIKSWDESICSMNDSIIDRVCEKVLPRIHDKIIKLTLETSAIERVLRAVDYPNVSSLSLVNLTRKSLIRYLTENPSRIELMNKQITHLNVHILLEKNNDNDEFNQLELILSFWKCLIDLTISQSIRFEGQSLPLSQSSSTIHLSLTKLNVHFDTLERCLFLFDGRLPSLSHCSVLIDFLFAPSSSIDIGIKLLQLKYFSLTAYSATAYYDDCVVPFLQRMSNLEELHLFLTVSKRDTYRVIDGNDLKNNLVIHLPRLKTFHFSIYTCLYLIDDSIRDENCYLSNDDIQQSFIGNQFGQVGSYVHKNSSQSIQSCHVYSLPYPFEEFARLSCSFSGGLFTRVRILAINDHVSWDYQFLNRVNQSFPLIETLMVCNPVPQENQSPLNVQFPMVTFNRLFDLRLDLLHDDYIQQLLFNRYTHLSCLRQLRIKYEQLIRLTNNFTIDPTELNCSQVQRLITNECFVRSQDFCRFFPLL